jgi:hypothetical protein
MGGTVGMQMGDDEAHLPELTESILEDELASLTEDLLNWEHGHQLPEQDEAITYYW